MHPTGGRADERLVAKRSGAGVEPTALLTTTHHTLTCRLPRKLRHSRLAVTEIPLTGGRVNEGVVRVGETVRRPTGQHTSFVHDLLLHLEQVEFDGAPRFLGTDDQGREVLSFLPGAPLAGTTTLTDDQIMSAASLLRHYHDAASSVSQAVSANAETVVHGDPGPWNILWQDDRAVALIDFDEARPGRRLEDVGYFAWKGLRLVKEGPPLNEQQRRLALLAAGYGVPVDDSLLQSIQAALAWLHAKGTREGWPMEALREIDGNARWLRDGLDSLR